MSQKLDVTIYPLEDLEKRFSFIENDTLRVNVSIAFRYITFLISLEAEYSLPGAISYSIFKDIILYTSTVVESCIHYCLKVCIDHDDIKISELMPSEWKDDTCVDLYLIPGEEKKVSGVVRHKKVEKFTEKTQFQTLNDIALKCGLFNQELFDKANKLRTDRNKIHLAGLSKTDDYYEKKDIQLAFDYARELIEAVEIRLELVRKVDTK